MNLVKIPMMLMKDEEWNSLDKSVKEEVHGLKFILYLTGSAGSPPQWIPVAIFCKPEFRKELLEDGYKQPISNSVYMNLIEDTALCFGLTNN